MVTRIRQLIEQKQLTPTQFADAIGVGRPVMSHILSERNKPSLEVVQRIIEAFPEISMSWLLRGTGEMLENGSRPANETIAAPTKPLEAIQAATEASAPADSLAEPSLIVPLTPLEAPIIAPLVTVPAALAQETVVAPMQPAAPKLPSPTPTIPASAELSSVASPKVEVPTPAAFKPSKAPRFVPTSVLAAPPAPAMPLASVAPPASLLTTPAPFVPAAMPAGASPAPIVPPALSAPASASPEATLLPLLSDSGKAIRRIVIFYRDGSFADYQPEQ
jgi:transcriptional regulator with XRE-family HTH domain